MSVTGINDIKYKREFQHAQSLLCELAEYAKVEPAFAMAAAAMWIGYELSKLPSSTAERDALIWFIDEERKPK